MLTYYRLPMLGDKKIVVPLHATTAADICKKLNDVLMDDDVTELDVINVIQECTGTIFKLTDHEKRVLQCYTVAVRDDFTPVSILPSLIKVGHDSQLFSLVVE